MPKVPLPGTSTADWAWYTTFRMRLISFITFWNFLDMWFRARSV